MRLVCVGEITLDRYLNQGIETVGGISLNVAVHARRCGALVALVSCVGDDAGGRLALAHLRRAGVDASHVASRPGATAHQDILIAPGGERVFPPGGYSAGVLADWSLSAEDLRFIRSHEVVVAPYFRQVAHIFDAAMGIEEGKRPVSAGSALRRVADFLDWGEIGGDLEPLERALPWLDIVYISGGEATVAALRPLARRYPGCVVVVTLGAAGSVALHGDLLVRQAAAPVAAVVDTTGCGDAFGAACTVAYLTHGDIWRALAAGAEQAAQVISQYGAS